MTLRNNASFCWMWKKVLWLRKKMILLPLEMHTDVVWNVRTWYLGFALKMLCRGLPRWLSGKESNLQCRRHQFDPWSRKIPHAAGQLSPCAVATEARAPKSLWSATREAAARKSPHMSTRSSPRSAQQEKSLHSDEDPPSTAKSVTSNKNLNVLGGK